MGIPRFAANLQPYSCSVSYPPDDPARKRSAVIDGPGLAYHAFWLAASGASVAEVPSYQKINAAAIQWLHGLEGHGIHIDQIYFDGLLPTTKKSERISRLQNYLRKLINFKARHDESRSRYSGTNYAALSRPIPSRLGSLCSPFLVPSMLEALQGSIYAARTTVVPGEADSWCAEYARESGCIVFTSDSDLLVHDIGEQSLVILFQDVDMSGLERPKPVIHMRAYHPHDMANRLLLRSLLSLAFAVVQDPSRSFNASIQSARSCDVDSAEYKEFAKTYQYSIRVACPNTLVQIPAQNVLSSRLKRLDPRISEFVQQVRSLAASPSAEPSSLIVDVYLPVLVEDPDRASPWNYSDHIRSLAYSLMTLQKHARPAVLEYARRGQVIMSRGRELYSSSDTISECAKLTSLLASTSAYGNLPIAYAWRLLAISAVLRDLSRNQIEAFPQHLLTQITKGEAIGQQWEFIHFSAQIQAFLYSLRMLHQITGIFLTIETSDIERKASIDAVSELHQVLEKLPSIEELFLPASNESPVEEEILSQAITKMYESLGIQQWNTPASNTKSKKKKRKVKGRKDGRAREETPPPQKSLNLYSVLRDN